MIENTPQAWSQRAVSRPTSWEAACWSEQGQRERFAAVLAALNPAPYETLLDFGCGTGALVEMCPEDVEYTGYDWSAGMIERAQREHNRGNFTCDFVPRFQRFDLIACVGTFNLADRWGKESTEAMLMNLWVQHKPRALACSLYAGNDPDCISYSQKDAARMAMRLLRHRNTRNSYHVDLHRENDLLLVVGG